MNKEQLGNRALLLCIPIGIVCLVALTNGVVLLTEAENQPF